MNDSRARPLAVVTGASSGIGFELARQFAQHRFDLLMVADEAAIVEAAAEIRELRVEAEGGRPVEAIAINAGVGVGGPFVDTTHVVRDMVPAGPGGSSSHRPSRPSCRHRSWRSTARPSPSSSPSPRPFATSSATPESR